MLSFREVDKLLSVGSYQRLSIEYNKWLKGDEGHRTMEALEAEVIMLRCRAEAFDSEEEASDKFAALMRERAELREKLGLDVEEKERQEQKKFLRLNCWEKMKLVDRIAGEALDNSEAKCKELI